MSKKKKKKGKKTKHKQCGKNTMQIRIVTYFPECVYFETSHRVHRIKGSQPGKKVKGQLITEAS